MKDTLSLEPINAPKFLQSDEPPSCVGTDPEAFYPQNNEDRNGNIIDGPGYYYDESGAKAVCAVCPHKMECLAYAIETGQIGIWGGTTEMDRRKIKRNITISRKVQQNLTTTK